MLKYFRFTYVVSVLSVLLLSRTVSLATDLPLPSQAKAGTVYIEGTMPADLQARLVKYYKKPEAPKASVSPSATMALPQPKSPLALLAPDKSEMTQLFKELQTWAGSESQKNTSLKPSLAKNQNRLPQLPVALLKPVSVREIQPMRSVAQENSEATPIEQKIALPLPRGNRFNKSSFQLKQIVVLHAKPSKHTVVQTVRALPKLKHLAPLTAIALQPKPAVEARAIQEPPETTPSVNMVAQADSQTAVEAAGDVLKTEPVPSVTPILSEPETQVLNPVASLPTESASPRPRHSFKWLIVTAGGIASLLMILACAALWIFQRKSRPLQGRAPIIDLPDADEETMQWEPSALDSVKTNPQSASGKNLVTEPIVSFSEFINREDHTALSSVESAPVKIQTVYQDPVAFSRADHAPPHTPPPAKDVKFVSPRKALNQVRPKRLMLEPLDIVEPVRSNDQAVKSAFTQAHSPFAQPKFEIKPKMPRL
jgi:hypothetical protein